MTALAPTLQAFFTDRLIGQRQASPHTICRLSRYLRLVLVFASALRPRSPRSCKSTTSTPHWLAPSSTTSRTSGKMECARPQILICSLADKLVPEPPPQASSRHLLKSHKQYTTRSVRTYR
jgi:hypothetical protein